MKDIIDLYKQNISYSFIYFNVPKHVQNIAGTQHIKWSSQSAYFTFHSYLVCQYFSCCYDKTPDQKDLRKQRFVLAHGLRAQSIPAGTHVRYLALLSPESGSTEMSSCGWLTLPFLFVSGPLSMRRCCPHVVLSHVFLISQVYNEDQPSHLECIYDLHKPMTTKDQSLFWLIG